MKKRERARLVSTESLASLKSAVAQIRPERDPVVSKDNNVVIDFRDLMQKNSAATQPAESELLFAALKKREQALTSDDRISQVTSTWSPC